MSERRKKLKDPELGRLLGGKSGPSVLEKEAAFEDVIAQTGGARARTWVPWLSMTVAASTAVLALFMLRTPSDPFTPKGEVRPVFRPHCLRAEAKVECAPGTKLVFEVQAPKSHPHLAVFSRRPDGAIIWYLPDAEGRTQLVPQDDPKVLETGFDLGPDHPEGAYTFFAVFSAEPKTRDDLKRELGDALDGEALIEIQRPVEIRATTQP